jgi:NAD(P)H-hydrate repair Nnr-like enzyme with NAD(P)H-hydrate dehydratase domain
MAAVPNQTLQVPRALCPYAALCYTGLGRNQSMLGRISLILEKVKSFNVPIVIDADGLWHLTTNPNILKV